MEKGICASNFLNTFKAITKARAEANAKAPASDVTMKAEVTILIKEAKDLKPGVSPFCSAIIGHQVQKSNIVQNSQKPQWNQSFK